MENENCFSVEVNKMNFVKNVKKQNPNMAIYDIENILNKYIEEHEKEKNKIIGLMRNIKSILLSINDLEKAEEILKYIHVNMKNGQCNKDNGYSNEDTEKIVTWGLVDISIIYIVKCFGHNKSDRISIKEKIIPQKYKNTFQSIKTRRDKIIAHDEMLNHASLSFYLRPIEDDAKESHRGKVFFGNIFIEMQNDNVNIINSILEFVQWLLKELNAKRAQYSMDIKNILNLISSKELEESILSK